MVGKLKFEANREAKTLAFSFASSLRPPEWLNMGGESEQ